MKDTKLNIDYGLIQGCYWPQYRFRILGPCLCRNRMDDVKSKEKEIEL